jgi:hypothetical protein
MAFVQGSTKGGGATGLQPPKPPQKQHLKKHFVDIMVPKFYVISPSSEISH